MYADELESKSLPIGMIYLDPNNPRWKSRTEKTVPDARIPEPLHQNQAMNRLVERYGIEELKNSILRNGFLPLDRIVVRTLSKDPDSYAVVEGNRRLAAIRRLLEEIDQEIIDATNLPEGYLEDLKERLQEIPCLVYNGDDQYINWMLQGIRHLSGIRDWMPAQQAELVVRQVDEGKSFTEVGQMFGLTNRQVGRLYRGYKGLRQMADDDEYGDKAKNDLFTLFDEAHRNPEVRKWLGWNDSEGRYENLDNLRRFYSWIIDDEEYEGALNPRRIHNPQHVKALNRILTSEDYDLLNEVENHAVTIETAAGRLEEAEQPEVWQAEIEKASRALSRVPAQAFVQSPQEARSKLEALRKSVDDLLSIVPVPGKPNGE
jgi:ParB-like nuclease domain